MPIIVAEAGTAFEKRPIIVAEAGTAFEKRHDYAVEMALPVRYDDPTRSKWLCQSATMTRCL